MKKLLSKRKKIFSIGIISLIFILILIYVFIICTPIGINGAWSLPLSLSVDEASKYNFYYFKDGKIYSFLNSSGTGVYGKRSNIVNGLYIGNYSKISFNQYSINFNSNFPTHIFGSKALIRVGLFSMDVIYLDSMAIPTSSIYKQKFYRGKSGTWGEQWTSLFSDYKPPSNAWIMDKLKEHENMKKQ